VLRSPTGVHFEVRSAHFVSEYLTVIEGARVVCDVGVGSNADSGVSCDSRSDGGSDDDVLDGDQVMGSDDDTVDHPSAVDGVDQISWPQLGWDVISLKGLVATSELSYDNPIVPPPLDARCHANATVDDLLFSLRRFYHSDEAMSRSISSDEYNQLIMDSEDVILLDTFYSSSKMLHKWKQTLEHEQDDSGDTAILHAAGDSGGDSDHDNVGGGCVSYAPDVVPHHYENEKVFMRLMHKCQNEVYYATKFRSSVVRHLYPHAKVQDRFIHFPLIPRDETTNEGMMLTNTSILESIGLLDKRDKGRYSLGVGTKNQFIFMYGDALTASLYGLIYDRILRQLTQLGNQNYIETLLAAQERVVVQKGQFHQLMHQLGAIYTQFYGGFMQAMQVANGVKRVNGDPVKGGCQCHHHFVIKLYGAANRLQLRAFCSSGLLNDLDVTDFPDNKSRIRSILQIYQAYRKSWEVSDYLPSRMVGLFMKSMRSYLRCKRAITSHDAWHLEIESCTIMSIWKLIGKTTYLCLQCEYLETFYNDDKVPPVYREIMRANAFCVKRSGTSIAFDDENENYNRIIKKTPVSPSLAVAVVRSRHVMISEKANTEV
jgi:hypothetical protein